MTVKQLIKKLSKMPDNAVVVFNNNEDYVDGMYMVTKVEDWTDFDNTVFLDSDFKKNYLGGE